jgi:hypothetical protein
MAPGEARGSDATLESDSSEDERALQVTRIKVRREGLVFAAKGSGHAAEGDLEPWLRWDSIWAAGARGDAHLLQRLLDSDKSLVNRVNTRHESALHLAAARGHTSCVLLLLEYDACGEADDGGKVPVELAVSGGHSECVAALCASGRPGVAGVVQPGTDDAACLERMLAVAATRSDYATLAVLQAHAEPQLAPVSLVGRASEPGDAARASAPAAVTSDALRRSAPSERRRQEAAAIRAAALEVRETSILVPDPALPKLGAWGSWGPREVARWVGETVPGAAEALPLRNLERFHVTGALLGLLTLGEVRALLQRVGFPPPFRTEVEQRVVTVLHGGASPRYGFSETRRLPVAIGNAAAFRIVGTVKAAMSTPLQTLRRFVSASSQVSTPLPEPFLFCSMLDGQPVQRRQEGQLLVSHLGFCIIVVPATADSASNNDSAETGDVDEATELAVR